MTSFFVRPRGFVFLCQAYFHVFSFLRIYAPFCTDLSVFAKKIPKFVRNQVILTCLVLVIMRNRVHELEENKLTQSGL